MRLLLCIVSLAGCGLLLTMGMWRENTTLACAGGLLGGLTLRWVQNEFRRRP